MYHAFAFVLVNLLGQLTASSLPGWTYATTTSTCQGTPSSPCGPSYWSKISSNCQSTVQFQSPINIVSSTVIKDDLKQGPIANSMANCRMWQQGVIDGSIFGISLNSTLCSDMYVSYAGANYILNSIQFHSPSEHAIGGGFFSGEARFIHFNAAGRMLVISVLLEEAMIETPGDSNNFLSIIFGYGGNTAVGLNTLTIVKNGTAINPYVMFTPARPSQYYYVGSATTPNCERSIPHFVFDHPVLISGGDMKLLRNAAAATSPNHLASGNSNNRPLQPIGNRIVSLIPGGTITTANPTASPTFGTIAPTTIVEIHHKRLRRPRPNTALLIGAVALGVSAILICIFSIYLNGLCKAMNKNWKHTDPQGDDIELIGIEGESDCSSSKIDNDSGYEEGQEEEYWNAPIVAAPESRSMYDKQAARVNANILQS